MALNLPLSTHNAFGFFGRPCLVIAFDLADFTRKQGN